MVAVNWDILKLKMLKKSEKKVTKVMDFFRD